MSRDEDIMNNLVGDISDTIAHEMLDGEKPESVEDLDRQRKEAYEQKKAALAKKKASAPTGKVEHRTLTKLREAFGLTEEKYVDADIPGFDIKLSSLSGTQAGWADSQALRDVVKSDGSYSIPDYHARRTIYVAACAVALIDGVKLTELFNTQNTLLAQTQFALFLFESQEKLGRLIYDAYTEKVEKGLVPDVKIESGLYECPTCERQAIHPLEGDWFCDKDGTQLERITVEFNVPQP